MSIHRYLKAVSCLFAVLASCAANAFLVEDQIFDGAFSAASQGFTQIGGAHQDVIPDAGTISGRTYLNTLSDETLLSGVYGPTPNLKLGGPDRYFSIVLPVLSETHSSMNESGFSIILIGPDPSKSIHIGIWSGSIWYYDENFNRSSLIIQDDAAGGFLSIYDFVFGHETVEFFNGFDPVPTEFPLFDYRTNAHTRDASISPIYSMPNTVFVGDESASAASEALIGAMFFTFDTTFIPLPPTIWFFTTALPLLLVARKSHGR